MFIILVMRELIELVWVLSRDDGKGIKAASGCFGFMNDVFDLLLCCG